MSRAFVKEEDNQWLNDIAPTMQALVRYLTNENNGIPVYEKKVSIDSATGKEVHEMSNSFSYAIDDNGKWYALE